MLATMHARGPIHLLLLNPGKQPLGVLNVSDGLRALRAAGNLGRSAAAALAGGYRIVGLDRKTREEGPGG